MPWEAFKFEESKVHFFFEHGSCKMKGVGQQSDKSDGNKVVYACLMFKSNVQFYLFNTRPNLS